MKFNKKYMPYIVGIVVFIMLSIGIYTNKHAQATAVSYHDFNQLVEAGEIESVELSDSPMIMFKKRNDEINYQTDNPRRENLKEVLLMKQINVKETNGTTGFYIIQYVLSATIFLGVFYIVFRGVKGKNNTGAMALGVKPVEATDLKVDFSSIAGNVEAKDQVQDIIDFIKSPEKFAAVGARMPKGVIFYGPPGTGKTLMAKAIAKEADVPFFSVSGSDFVQLYVGVGASRVREIFGEARKHQKAVIFIDEIDAIGKKRSQNVANSNDEKDQTLNALLTEMSGFQKEEGIVVIAATNRLDMLDDALLRPGRFDRHVEIGYPDKQAREQIIRLYLKDKPVAEDVISDAIAKQTVFFTGAMLENLLNEAAILAAKMASPVITNEHVQKAFYIVIAGTEKKDKSSISSLDREITAYHEAGHALITKLVAPDNSVTKVTIIPSTKGAGGFSMNIPKDKMYLTKMELVNQIRISLAGRAAEELVFGEEAITTGASNDIEKATKYLKDYMTKYGMDKEIGLVNLEILTEGRGIDNQQLLRSYQEKMQQIYKETKQLLINNLDKLESLAGELLEKETLDECDIDRLMSA
ncbi:MAG: ATP-dependent metallopeptidase FtsH/Yme1/Tma family protein [Cellulosilyticaceae bacterium]